jgi:hypothetical protein
VRGEDVVLRISLDTIPGAYTQGMYRYATGASNVIHSINSEAPEWPQSYPQSTTELPCPPNPRLYPFVPS